MKYRNDRGCCQPLRRGDSTRGCRGRRGEGHITQPGGFLMAGSTQQGVSGSPIGRRTFLRGVAASLPLPCAWPGGVACAQPPGGDKKAPPGGGGAGGLIVREKE